MNLTLGSTLEGLFFATQNHIPVHLGFAPYVDHHRKLLEDFLGSYWAYYDQLLIYRERPAAAEKGRLARAFDDLFATVTGYAALDERIVKTRAKKESLLLVLDHPEIPLHNNESDLGARWVVRAYSGEIDHPFRCESGRASRRQTGHRFRSKLATHSDAKLATDSARNWPPLGVERNGCGGFYHQDGTCSCRTRSRGR